MRRLAALLLCVLLLSGCAAAPERNSVPTAEPAAPSPLPTAPEHPYEPLRVYLDGLLTDRGYLRNGTAYLAPETICAYYGLAHEETADAQNFSLTLPGLTVTGSRNLSWFLADGRYLYAPDGWIEADGRLYLPAETIEHIFGLPVTLSGEPLRAEVGSTGYRLLQGGEDYYEKAFHADDLYWLEHIIYAEAHHESLACQIGVGNVVLNRLAHRDFPGTITGVVLDREHTVQFEPVGSGEVAAEPDETARIAARLCLEGFNTAGDSLYFVNPARGDPSWFSSSLRFVCRIGHLDFYR